jgi:hypothetical protein
MWQFAEAVRGLADGCQQLGIPVTGGNVSFYNESSGRPIHPTPIVGVLGLLEDAEDVSQDAFLRAFHRLSGFRGDAPTADPIASDPFRQDFVAEGITAVGQVPVERPVGAEAAFNDPERREEADGPGKVLGGGAPKAAGAIRTRKIRAPAAVGLATICFFMGVMAMPLADALAERDGVLGLPMIVNKKTVDPGDKLPRDHPMVKRDPEAFVKVQDGCSFSCNFCVIPLVRGASRSRRAPAVLAEIEKRVRQGHREVVLTGINLGCFRDRDAGFTLARLIREAGAVPGLERLRLSSIEINHVDDDLEDLEVLVDHGDGEAGREVGGAGHDAAGEDLRVLHLAGHDRLGQLERARAQERAVEATLRSFAVAALTGVLFGLAPALRATREPQVDISFPEIEKFVLDGQQARLTQAALETLAVPAERPR